MSFLSNLYSKHRTLRQQQLRSDPAAWNTGKRRDFAYVTVPEHVVKGANMFVLIWKC